MLEINLLFFFLTIRKMMIARMITMNTELTAAAMIMASERSPGPGRTSSGVVVNGCNNDRKCP